MGKLPCKRAQVVLPISFYEKDVNNLYNSVACIDADGTLLGVYRKTHIPDDHYYQEKFYSHRAIQASRHLKHAMNNRNWHLLGSVVSRDSTQHGTLGAEILLYPTAIGSEPILECDSMPHWRRVMQGHAAANLMPVIAANRIGTETVEPCEGNGGQTSALNFYGSSFIADETGELISEASRDQEEILYSEFDLEELAQKRLEWGLFRDRRPEMYGITRGRSD